MSNSEPMTEDEVRSGSNDYRELIENFIETMAGLDPEAREYQSQGEFRTVSPLTSNERSDAERLKSDCNMEPKQCYLNAQRAILQGESEYTYVEGYTASTAVPIPIQHAWLERNDKVIEVTFSDGPDPREGATYFGVAYSDDAVIEQMAKVEKAIPLASARQQIP